jgi:hypothetical protein
MALRSEDICVQSVLFGSERIHGHERDVDDYSQKFERGSALFDLRSAEEHDPKIRADLGLRAKMSRCGIVSPSLAKSMCSFGIVAQKRRIRRREGKREMSSGVAISEPIQNSLSASSKMMQETRRTPGSSSRRKETMADASDDPASWAC